MSAVLAPPAPTVSAPHPAEADVVAYVRALPDEQQEAVFVSILKALIEDSGGKGYIPIESGGEWLGYFVPPAAAKAQFDRHGPKLSPERLAEIQRAAANPGRSFTLEEMLERLSAADEDRVQ